MSEGSHPRGPGPRVQRSGAPQGASPGPRPAGGTPAARAAPEAGSSPLPRASEPRVSPRRDPRRPLSSPPGPSLSLAERGLFEPSSPVPPRPEWPGSPTGPFSFPLLLSNLRSTLDPSFWPPRVHQASRRDPGSPGESPSLSPGLSFPPPTRAPSACLPTGSIRPAGGTPAARCQFPLQPPSLCLQARAPAFLPPA